MLRLIKSTRNEATTNEGKELRSILANSGEFSVYLRRLLRKVMPKKKAPIRVIGSQRDAEVEEQIDWSGCVLGKSVPVRLPTKKT